MNHSDSLTKIAPALVAALAHIGGAKKGKVNPAFRSRYADLESVIAASKDILAENGLALIQLPGACASGIMNLETVFVHESGEWISGEMGMALGKADPQGVGSALTYMRRYAQMSALNMPAVDDDGERAMGRKDGAPVQEAPASQRKSAAQAKRDGDDTILKTAIGNLNAEDLIGWNKNFDELTAHVPASWLDSIRDMLIMRAEELNAVPIEAADELDRQYAETVR